MPAQPLLEQRVTKSQDEVDDMYEPITPDDLVRKEWTNTAKCPDDVMATLLPYQAEGYAFRTRAEHFRLSPFSWFLEFGARRCCSGLALDSLCSSHVDVD